MFLVAVISLVSIVLSEGLYHMILQGLARFGIILISTNTEYQLPSSSGILSPISMGKFLTRKLSVQLTEKTFCWDCQVKLNQ